MSTPALDDPFDDDGTASLDEVDEDLREDNGYDDDMICPKCGAGMYFDAQKCPRCGAWVTPVTPGSGSAATSGRQTLFAVLVVLVILSFMILMLR